MTPTLSDRVPEPPAGTLTESETLDSNRGRLEPPCGLFPWSLRANAPGMDTTAVDLRAVLEGFLPRGVTDPPGPHDPSGSLPEFMAFAFASAYDRMVCHRLGLSTPPDIPNVEGLLAFGYACCTRLAALNDATVQVRPVHQTAEMTDGTATEAEHTTTLPTRSQ